MAMSKVKFEDFLKEDVVNLESVKQLIEEQEILKACDSPLLQSQILDFSGSDSWKSDLFVIGNDVYVAQLILRASEDEWNITMRLECLLEDGSKSAETFSSSQLFRCQLILYDGTSPNPIRKEISLSFSVFNPDARVNKIHFHFENCTSGNATLEIYGQSLNFGNYVSLLPNAVVDKIEKFSEHLMFAFENVEVSIISPRFELRSADQKNRKMMVSFGHPRQNLLGIHCVWVTLHIIEEKEAQVEAPFKLKVTITIFNQRESGRDFIKKVVLPIVENKRNYSLFLAWNNHLTELGCLEEDTLYYMVVVEPFNFN